MLALRSTKRRIQMKVLVVTLWRFGSLVVAQAQTTTKASTHEFDLKIPEFQGNAFDRESLAKGGRIERGYPAVQREHPVVPAQEANVWSDDIGA